jgi:hypothetical protein
MKITKAQLKQIIKEVLNEDETLDDFWMNELNSALLASMASAGVGNSMMPSKFLEALLPVLQAYGVADEAEEMVNHVRSNQDIYSPGLPALQELKQIIAEETRNLLLEKPPGDVGPLSIEPIPPQIKIDYDNRQLEKDMEAREEACGIGSDCARQRDLPRSTALKRTPRKSMPQAASAFTQMAPKPDIEATIASRGDRDPSVADVLINVSDRDTDKALQEEQGAPDYTQHVGSRFQATADNFGERMVLGGDPYEIEVTKGGFKVIGAPTGREDYVGREFSAPGTEGYDERFWTVAMRELGQAAGREGGIYAPPTPEPVIPEVPPAATPSPTLADAESDASMGEAQDPFQRLCEVALKPYGSTLK